MKKVAGLITFLFACGAWAQSPTWQPDLTRQQDYVAHRASSADPAGANHDARQVLEPTGGPGNAGK